MSLEQRIECKRSEKLLARVTQDGVKLWCEKHRREELFTWEEIDVLRYSLTVTENTATNQTVIISH